MNVRKFLKIGLFIAITVALFYSCGLARDVIDKNMPQEDAAATTEDVLNSIKQQANEDTVAPLQDEEDTLIQVLSKKEIKKLKKEREKQDRLTSGDTIPWFKKKKEEFFPTKIDRDSSFPKMYSEKPKTILVLCPWNRSKIQRASQMFVINIGKQLSQRGYYVLPPTITFALQKEDSTFCSRYTKFSDVKKFKEKYGVDAVMFVTIYTLRKNWWSTNINSVAEYYLISTTTSDTLFYRKADFNYDSPIPPYTENKTKDTYRMDQKSLIYFGACYQMQNSVFMDFPFGHYHKEYMKDRKKFSYKKEMKYKLDMRPS